MCSCNLKLVKFVWTTAHDLGSDEAHGIWRIDDKENSFFTQPFWIKYARQDIRLCMMVSFNIPLDKYQVLSLSDLLNKFHLFCGYQNK